MLQNSTIYIGVCASKLIYIDRRWQNHCFRFCRAAIYHPNNPQEPELRINGGAWFELKASTGSIFLSSNTYQIAGHIDNLRRQNAILMQQYRGFAPIMIINCILLLLSMKPLNSGYRIVSKSECERYIVEKGVDLQDINWYYAIPSKAAVVYTLPNGEVVVVPVTSLANYPGFIFENIDAFDKLVKEDYFPIDKHYMTWLEAHADSVRQIDESSIFYRLPLQKAFGIEFPLKSPEEIKVLFNKVKSYIGTEEIEQDEKQEMVYCYAMAVIIYLKDIRGYKLQMDKFYGIYNPYFQPLIIFPDGRRASIFDQCFMAFNRHSGNIFERFQRNVRI